MELHMFLNTILKKRGPQKIGANTHIQEFTNITLKHYPVIIESLACSALLGICTVSLWPSQVVCHLSLSGVPMHRKLPCNVFMRKPNNLEWIFLFQFSLGSNTTRRVGVFSLQCIYWVRHRS